MFLQTPTIPLQNSWHSVHVSEVVKNIGYLLGEYVRV